MSLVSVFDMLSIAGVCLEYIHITSKMLLGLRDILPSLLFINRLNEFKLNVKNTNALHTTLGFVQVWLDKQTSANCKSKLWFGLDKQL